MNDLISRQAAIYSIRECAEAAHDNHEWDMEQGYLNAIECVEEEPSAQPEIEKICTRIKAETIKRNVEYMKHGDRYMIGFVDGMRLARRIVDGTIDDPVYFTLSEE